MAREVRGGGAPPGTRRELALALATAALGGGAQLSVPLEYALDRLAKRWGIPPWELDSADPAIARWVQRGLLFERLEGEAVTKHRKARG